MRVYGGALVGAFLFLQGLLAPSGAVAAPVLLVSIDGLRPGDVIEADRRGLKIPTLRALEGAGAYADGVVNVTPTVTYPNHTTLITGVAPRTHRIANNTVFDPLGRNEEGWYWYSEDIAVPTLWDAVHDTGGRVASIGWPVSVGARSIDENLPEYWRARTPDDIKLLRVLCTPGLPEALEAASGVGLAAMGSDTSPEGDEAKASLAAALYALRPPRLMTLHLSSLDHVQHIYGPGTPEAHAALERIDGDLTRILAAARKAEPDLVTVVVSDHGFTEVSHDVNLYRLFVDAGLITLGPSTHKPTGWEAAPWGGASVAVVLAHPDDPVVFKKVAALMAALKSDPELGVGRIIGPDEIARRGIAPGPSFYIDFKLGYEMGSSFEAPKVSPSLMRGTHGYFADHPEMHSTFIVAGPGVAHAGSLGIIDMRDIAVTVARILNVDLPRAEGRGLLFH